MKIVGGILSPEGMKLSLVPFDVACRHADHALADAITPMHFKKLFAAAEPGEMMPLA